jgi:superfamily II DNA helicase RecQ
MLTPASILKEIFGYDTFRPLQREVIENVLAKRWRQIIVLSNPGAAF